MCYKVNTRKKYMEHTKVVGEKGVREDMINKTDSREMDTSRAQDRSRCRPRIHSVGPTRMGVTP